MNLFLFLFLALLSLICMADTKSTKNDEGSKQIVGNSLEKLNQIEDLANKSAKFLPYCWGNRKELNGCFRASSVMFIGYDKNDNNLAYLYLVEGQSEDSGLIYRLKIQNLSTNKILLDRKFFYEVDSKEYENKELKNINYFYRYKENEIRNIIKKYDLIPSVFSFKYLPYYDNNSSLFFGFSTIKTWVKFGYSPPEKILSLNNLIIKKNNNLIFKQNYSKGGFCPECIYPFFLLEPLTIVEISSSGQRIIIFGLLAYDFHSPNTLFFQVVGV